MGDMADMLRDSFFMGDPYRDIQEDGPRGSCCKYCGMWGLRWYKTDGEWRLHTSSLIPSERVLHECPEYQKVRGADAVVEAIEKQWEEGLDKDLKE